MVIAKFNSTSKYGKELSNFAELPVEINGIKYPTGEHAFHGEKYRSASATNEERNNQLLEHAARFQDTEMTPKDAKRMGGKKGMKLDASEIDHWNNCGAEDVQKMICKYKYDTYESVRKVLVDHSEFLHQENRANDKTIWGGRIKDGVLIGQNKLGLIWKSFKPEPVIKRKSVANTTNKYRTTPNAYYSRKP